MEIIDEYSCKDTQRLFTTETQGEQVLVTSTWKYPKLLLQLHVGANPKTKPKYPIFGFIANKALYDYLREKSEARGHIDDLRNFVCFFVDDEFESLGSVMTMILEDMSLFLCETPDIHAKETSKTRLDDPKETQEVKASEADK